MQAALETCGQVLKSRPRHADALVIRGAAHVRGGDVPAACRDFKAALAVRPDHPTAAKYLAKVQGKTV